MPEQTEPVWRRSRHSFSNGNCVEVAGAPGAVLVRDSKDPDGPRLAFAPGAWRAFLGAVKMPLCGTCGNELDADGYCATCGK